MTPFLQMKHFNSSCKTLLKSFLAYFATDAIFETQKLQQLQKLSYSNRQNSNYVQWRGFVNATIFFAVNTDSAGVY